MAGFPHEHSVLSADLFHCIFIHFLSSPPFPYLAAHPLSSPFISFFSLEDSENCHCFYWDLCFRPDPTVTPNVSTHPQPHNDISFIIASDFCNRIPGAKSNGVCQLQCFHQKEINFSHIREFLDIGYL